MTRARSNPFVLFFIWAIPLILLAGGIIGSINKENYQTLAVLIIILIPIYWLFSRHIFDVVLDKEGLLLNQRIPIEWMDVSRIQFLPIIRVFVATANINNRPRFIVFPSERGSAWYGFVDDNMKLIVDAMRKKYKI